MVPTTIPLPETYPSSHTKPSDVRVNVFLLLSLFFSIVTTYNRMKVEWWVQEYMKVYQKDNLPSTGWKTNFYH